MQLPSAKILVPSVVVVAVIGLGLGRALLGSRPTAKLTQSTETAAPSAPKAPDRNEPPPRPARPPRGSTHGAVPAPTEAVTDASPPAAVDWPLMIETILDTPEDDAHKVQQFLALLPQMPETNQVEVAEYLTTLVADDGYAPLTTLVTNAQTPEAVLEVLAADLLNRPNSVKLPLLLEIARQTDHPRAEDSRTVLEVYLEEDFGTDWERWRQTLEAWLRENPD